MRVRLTIGDFSRMTHLSVKALRHYHDVGLLEPAEIDPASGYRFYEPAQVSTAQVIRRFRDLGMPLEEIRSVLRAPDVSARNQVIAAHMRRMESQLAQTGSVVASLRALLERGPGSSATTIAVEHRSVDPVLALAISEHVSVSDLDTWWDQSFRDLDAALGDAGVAPAGPRGALYSPEYFALEDGGEVVAFIPIPDTAIPDTAIPDTAIPDTAIPDTAIPNTAIPIRAAALGRIAMTEIPAAELAVAVHVGSFADLDRTYGALGIYVAEREIGIDGPIREHYLVTPFDTGDESRHLTEICWPVFQTA